MKKFCKDCRQFKDIKEFYKLDKKRKGYRSKCKKCFIIQSSKCRKKWQEKNIDLYKLRNKEKYWKNKTENLILVNHWRKKNRCRVVFQNIKSRVKNHFSYKNIKNCLTLAEIKYLWFRDKAYLMEKPSIDRINPNDNYRLDNCRFIELSENIKRAVIERFKKTGSYF